MPVVAAVFAIAAATWGAICARRGSLLVGCGLLVAVAYALGHEFWNAKLGPMPVTFDRVLLLGIVAAFAYQWRYGGLTVRPWTRSRWILAAMLARFTHSAPLNRPPEINDGVTFDSGT